MRTLYPLIVINIGLLLTSCATINEAKPIDTMQTSPTPDLPQKAPKSTAIPPSCPAPTKDKNPLAVSFYSSHEQLKKNYKILGIENVSKYNTAGIKRQEATIQDTMRKLAAKMGGDAIINVKRNNNQVSGTVVSFEDEKQQNKKV